MYKKYIIIFLIGLLLLSAGGSSLWWIITERRKEQQQADSFRLKYSSETNEYIQQYEKWLLLPPEERTELLLGLDSDGSAKTQTQLQQEQQERLTADLDKLAAGEMTVYPFADDFYGENWQEKLGEYKKQKELSEFILTGSIMCTSFGGIIVGWIVLINIARLIIRILVGLKNCVVNIFRTNKESDDSPLSEAETEEPVQEKQPKEQQNQFRDISKVLMNSGWQHPEFTRGRSKIRRQKSEVSINSESCLKNNEDDDMKEHLGGRSVQKTERTPEVKSSKKEIRSKDEQQEETILTVSSEQSNPIDNTLKDLSQQVSAIREYAAHQQNRLEKLQDGYDWNIIKSFCLRIIRCIDNIECRITQLTEQECEVTDLEEVRDELIFALESSGVEQFEPEINSEYRGQEKFAEAVKEKKQCNNPEQRGTIEKVLRPGYQCFIDEENVRIVRPAQVRLYA